MTRRRQPAMVETWRVTIAIAHLRVTLALHGIEQPRRYGHAADLPEHTPASVRRAWEAWDELEHLQQSIDRVAKNERESGSRQ